MDSRLPDICYVRVPGNAPERAVVLVKKGESGYRPSRVQVPASMTQEQITNLVNELNADLGITQFVLSDTPYLREIERQGSQLLPLLRG